jgi:hypothetical protein
MEQELLLKPHKYEKKQAQKKKKHKGMVEMWNMLPNCIMRTIHQHGDYPGHNETS